MHRQGEEGDMNGLPKELLRSEEIRELLESTLRGE